MKLSKPIKFKPLLAATLENFEDIRFPVLASPKLDGIRALVLNGKLVSRTLKPIPNDYIREWLSKPLFEGLDGELVVGEPTDPMCYRNTVSGVMSKEGRPNYTYYVFDDFSFNNGFIERFSHLSDRIYKDKHLKLVSHKLITDIEELIKYEEECVKQGFEGVMLRSLDGRYKHGRSTVKEGILLKVKRFMDTEMVIIDFEERMHNANEATTNALGRTERSSHKENMQGRGDLGALVVDYKGSILKVGSGFDDKTRKEIWDNKSKYLGAKVKVKFMDYGAYEVPRFPTFLGIRHEDDVSP